MFELDNIASFFIVFFSTFFADIAWTFYLLKVEERKSVQASLWGCVIFLFGAIVTSHYINNLWLLIPAILGSFLGVYSVIEYTKFKDKNGKR